MCPLPAEDPGLVAALRAAGCVFAEEEAAVLLAEATGPAHLAALLARRVAGEPLELVVGWAAFCGLRVAVEPGVFVPRRRTALLVEQAVAALRHTGGTPVVVDLCCGSGAVGLAVAAAGPVELHAADVDPVAVGCARRNLAPAGGRVHRGDLYAALPAGLRGRVDVLAVNAPYVPSAAVALMPPEARDHEPRAALDGGPDGTGLHRRVAAGARRWLAPGGTLLVETSAGLAPATAAAVRAGGLRPVVVRDEDRDATVVAGTAPGGRVPERSPSGATHRELPADGPVTP
ncbi:release factor glutamine methyltransferase [Geodermatophilus pulveris]|uniref:peptide chain release factor N(5)-glutamine methyltransferase n=1 Tax=Geodermatophilus pulveris TaxID=1564159 RepID=A0A239HZU0_9ACTN|nr:release factor glutamine methyltransferase [Geodermatophilus pulveris]